MEPFLPPDHIRCPDCGSMMQQVNNLKAIGRDMLCLVCRKFVTAYKGPNDDYKWLIFEPIRWWAP